MNRILAGLMTSAAFIVPAAAQQATDVGQITVDAPQEAPGAGYIIPEESPKERSTVTEAAIAQAAPSANVFQLMNRLPGVNAYSTDAPACSAAHCRCAVSTVAKSASRSPACR